MSTAVRDGSPKLVITEGVGSLREGIRVTYEGEYGEGSTSSSLKKLQKGDKVNISWILFNSVLIRNDGQRVNYDHLKDKVIVLFFVPLSPWCDRLKQDLDSLVDIYNDIHSSCPFEVVFIGFKIPKGHPSRKDFTKSSEEYFQDMFSIMPWTALPYSPDTCSLKFWQERLSYPPPFLSYDSYTFSLVIDSSGMVLQTSAENIFLLFGAEAYPFSDKRVSYIEDQDQNALDSPSITNLLTSPGHGHVITNDNKEVPVKDLEDKVVVLYFYEDCEYQFDGITKMLKDVYCNLMPEKKDKFEVVLVYIHNSIDARGRASEESFWNAFHGMPWLALPFKHPRVKNLKRIFDYFGVDGSNADPRLVIIGPQGNFVEPYGVDIFKNFPAAPYPFTRKEALKLVIEYTKTLKLDMFLGPNTSCIQKDGSKVKLSQLVGKKIVLIFEGAWGRELPKFWDNLAGRYHSMKKSGDPFEVIYVPYKPHKCFSFCKHDSTLPWLTAPPFLWNSKKRYLVGHVFRGETGLLAFDGDGRVVRRTKNPHIQEGNVHFPFYDGGLEAEALKDLIDSFQWYDSRAELVRGL